MVARLSEMPALFVEATKSSGIINVYQIVELIKYLIMENVFVKKDLLKLDPSVNSDVELMKFGKIKNVYVNLSMLKLMVFVENVQQIHGHQKIKQNVFARKIIIGIIKVGLATILFVHLIQLYPTLIGNTLVNVMLGILGTKENVFLIANKEKF